MKWLSWQRCSSASLSYNADLALCFGRRRSVGRIFFFYTFVFFSRFEKTKKHQMELKASNILTRFSWTFGQTFWITRLHTGRRHPTKLKALGLDDSETTLIIFVFKLKHLSLIDLTNLCVDYYNMLSKTGDWITVRDLIHYCCNSVIQTIFLKTLGVVEMILFTPVHVPRHPSSGVVLKRNSCETNEPKVWTIFTEWYFGESLSTFNLCGYKGNVRLFFRFFRKIYIYIDFMDPRLAKYKFYFF